VGEVVIPGGRRVLSGKTRAFEETIRISIPEWWIRGKELFGGYFSAVCQAFGCLSAGRAFQTDFGGFGWEAGRISGVFPGGDFLACFPASGRRVEGKEGFFLFSESPFQVRTSQGANESYVLPGSFFQVSSRVRTQCASSLNRYGF
jgi:hypothetical protein